MPVVISHNSALELLRAVPPQVRPYPFVRETLAMELISTDSRELRRLDLSEFGVHLDPEKDLRRKEALEHMGWTINTIKLDQTADHRELMRAVALFEDEATVKTLRRREGTTWLMPANDSYEPIDGTHAQIIGKVVAVVRRYA